ncbi:hypothetical protein CC85DRAFT_311959 [Cutaneotrichosporon oleaginosum]|uniref:Uncharacterized protein n=1 Tax=Cutaneotrichosporon oleaginosum TaxID=879819 RepID=A0A0J1B5P9_9TREE|nr:uncharacterized protein CC85DRAFT_311959 [Cutaneotrichosporon oleaginosum]KLT43024.1 hypothetical protein CC85DRAFT_311959 [Cutaneotrichosporon oleaginosum]TXT11773.1 hypothetical protein COLE_02183 [Cutaneotrichosporon oleaginosum]
MAHVPPPPRLRAAIPSFVPAPHKPKKPAVRIDIVETQASAAREAYLAERLAQIDGWAYDQKPWGPTEMPVPSSLPFGRDPRARVRARVEEVMRDVAPAAAVPVAVKDEPGTQKAEKDEKCERSEDEPVKPGKTLKDRRRWSMLSLKSAAEEAPKPEKEKQAERGPPSAFKRWSVIKSDAVPGIVPDEPPSVPTHTRSTSEMTPARANATAPPAPLKRNRRWSLQNLKEVLTRDKEGAEVKPVPTKLEAETAPSLPVPKAKPEATIITHLPERSSSISPSKPKKSHSLPSPTMSLVSLDLDFDLFGLSSDSQSVKTPPESSAPEPAPTVTIKDVPNASPVQLLAERDAWRHEALLLYDQLCYWRLEALERGRERDGWRGVALAVGVQVPPCVVKTLPAAAAPLSDAQRRTREVEREREKGRERVREWHLASIERERREHAAREAERRAEARETAERRELDRRVRERRARERHIEMREAARLSDWAGLTRREGEPRHPSAHRAPSSRHSRQHSREWAPSGAAEAAADAMAVVGAAPAGVLPPPGLPGPVSPMSSWGRQSRTSSYAGAHRFPAPHDHSNGVPEHEHDARPRAVGWPASESGRERAREMLTPPRGASREAMRSGTA